MNTRHDTYRDMARHYDLHGWDWYARLAGPRLVELLRSRGVGPGASVLDAGCGTGSLALLLAEAGYRVTAFDLSPAMIARAKTKSGADAVDWRTGDLTSFDFGATFDAAVSVADVLNHLESLDEWESAFQRLRAHLRPGGVLVADVMTCRGLTQLDGQSVQERNGTTLICSIIWDPATRRSTLKVTSFVPASGGQGLYERAQDTITEWGQPVAGALERARRAGFATVERVWSAGDDPEAEDRLTIAAW